MRYTLVGHVSKDIVPSAPKGFLWGGTVTYSGQVVAQLGADVSVFTCAEEATDLRNIDTRLKWHFAPSNTTTTFVNMYDQMGNRHQTWSARARNIILSEFPELDPAPDIIHLAPVAVEISLEEIETFAQKYPESWLVSTPQGWMRRFDQDGHVYPIDWEHAEAMLSYMKAAVFSQEDIGERPELARSYARKSGIPIVYTKGAEGAILFQGNEQIVINAIPAQVADPTGAGDVIAATFFIRYFETGDPLEAVIWGTAAASIGIEHVGATGLPTLAQIEERLSQWPEKDRLG